MAPPSLALSNQTWSGSVERTLSNPIQSKQEKKSSQTSFNIQDGTQCSLCKQCSGRQNLLIQIQNDHIVKKPQQYLISSFLSWIALTCFLYLDFCTFSNGPFRSKQFNSESIHRANFKPNTKLQVS